LIGVASIVTCFVVFQLSNAELGGEVVVLHTTGPDGSVQQTRLWIVDDGEVAWLRARGPDASWLKNLVADPGVEVERSGTRQRFTAAPQPAAQEHVDRLMAQAYGINEYLRLSVLLRSAPGIPVRLEPLVDAR
jgi:hypothetical protein